MTKNTKQHNDEPDVGESSDIQTPGLSASDTRGALVRRVIHQMRRELDALERMLHQDESSEEARVELAKMVIDGNELLGPMEEGRVVEGVFDGEHMVGEDGRKYLVPPNYASKSKLVEGDLLRLVIDDRGRFIYKQRGPIERERHVGTLMEDENTGEWKVGASGQSYRVLTASVTFFGGETGDEAVILTPRNTPSKWAAIENILKENNEEEL